jgi:hypothetical protein
LRNRFFAGETVGDGQREKFFHNKAFGSMDALEDQLGMALVALEDALPRVQSIAAWDWLLMPH